MSSTLPSYVSSLRTGGLQRLLGNFDPALFLQTYLGEQMLHVSGLSDRWSDLFSWQELNAVLSSGFISVPRVRLVSKGVNVDASLYSEERGERKWPDSRRVQELMAQGATLILMNIEGVNVRVNAFVRELERDLDANVRVDVIATCTSVPGLNTHWDNAECFNVQLDGEKRWQVIRPERPYPLTATSRFPARADILKPTIPDVPPTWEGTVVPGDLLYLPRGWWHTVTPHVSPSLHLSIAVDIPTMHDFLQWFALESVCHEHIRQSLPVWQSAMARRERLTETLVSLKEALSADDVERYLSRLASSAVPRPDYALPNAAAPGTPRLTARTAITLRSAKPLGWTLDGETVSFTWRDHPYRFHAQLLPVLQKFDTMHAFTLDELSDGTNRLLVRACVLVLITAGIVTVTERVFPSEN